MTRSRSSRARDSEIWTLIGLVAALSLYLVLAYRQALFLPLLNDDYFFLQKVQRLSFAELWNHDQLYFYWYRPWSRELHYWVLWKAFGVREVPFHVVSQVLWLLAMALYFGLIHGLTRDRATSFVAVIAVASLSLWGAPLHWVAGAQDLWMVVFGLTFLNCLMRGRDTTAAVALALALLSKETAAVLAAIGTAYLILVEGLRGVPLLRRSAAPWAVTALWAVIHPNLLLRVAGGGLDWRETSGRLPWDLTVIKTLLAQLNLDEWPAPEDGWLPASWRAMLAASVFAGFLIVVLRSGTPADEFEPRGIRRFAGAWAIVGWSVYLLPSLGWHAYYGVLGALGYWLLLATWLSRHRRVAVAVVACLAALHEARVTTPSWDWGTDWYQRRAGWLLGSIRTHLQAAHPAPAPGSRFFFARIPNQIGFLAGDGPAVRIWYGDSTLRAYYYSDYSPRSAADSVGVDLFFRFDTLATLVEVVTGPENIPRATAANPQWRADHEVLAAMFGRTGNVSGAASEYAKLLDADPERCDFAFYAGVSHQALGGADEARRYLDRAESCYGSAEAVRLAAAQLIERIRAPVPTPP